MKLEEIIKLAETISVILHQTDRQDLIEPLIQLVNDYERINDEISTFVHGEVESSSSSDESDDNENGECPEDELKVKVDDEGFHSIA
tara:strand:- start:204 stop:464 length:261 start_codon:yes stop_codon:yes gene_type:complete